MKKYLLLICAVIALFTACKKNDIPPVVDPLKSISLGRDTLTMRVGQTFQLSITTVPEGYNKSLLLLSSSDTTVVTVKNDGKLTAKKNGTAVITATNQLKTISVTCLVTVAGIPDPLTGVLFTDTLSMEAGDVVQLHYTTTPPNYDPNLLVWKSSDTTVVSVSSNGKVTAKEEGVASVTLTNKAKTFSVSGIVSVTDRLKIGLLAFYPFNNSTKDLSGHNFNGVAYNLTSAPDRFGKANAAYSFNGTSSYIKVNDDQQLRLNNTDITLNAWVKLDDYNSSFGNNVLSKHLSGSENGWAWGITGYGFYPTGVLTYGPGGGSASARGAIVINRNNWHMITSIYNLSSQKLSLYVDGVLDGVTYNIPSPNVTTNTGLYIGRDNPEVPTNGYFIHGSLDDIRIYNRSLNANEVHKLFVATK
jgi:hypothetical protein